ncbi:hypothetical protein BDZ85DRAFT_256390 [Elsinoe ampelina]|uniref:Uncharacterized protein n=1 Tax=Elsinoe ampelina TaxID=302913 RepID=A0A6A6GMK3_9PEZI|nr:hypothetical protein BDZ85DRAFT_256390 [Elsinoe ampelina]
MDGGHSADSLRLLITWPTLWDQTLTNMLIKKRRNGSPAPDSFVLVMLSYYAVMLHMMSGFWWINGLARVVMSQVEAMLDEQWRPFIAKPKYTHALRTTDPKERR